MWTAQIFTDLKWRETKWGGSQTVPWVLLITISPWRLCSAEVPAPRDGMTQGWCRQQRRMSLQSSPSSRKKNKSCINSHAFILYTPWHNHLSLELEQAGLPGGFNASKINKMLSGTCGGVDSCDAYPECSLSLWVSPCGHLSLSSSPQHPSVSWRWREMS